MLVAGSGWVAPSDYDARTRDWYEEAVAAKGPVVTQPYLDADTKKMILTVAEPMHDGKGQLIGVIAVDVELDIIQQTSPPSTSSASVFECSLIKMEVLSNTQRLPL